MDLALVDVEASQSHQVESMQRACRDLGFFRIPIAAVTRSVADEAWDTAAEFFAMPVEEKQRVGFPEPGYPYGYSPFGFESLAKSVGTGAREPAPPAPDLKESFSVGPDCADSHGEHFSADQAWIRSPSLWPDRPAALQPGWVGYYRELSAVAEHLMSIMAVALRLPADYFAPMIDQPITSMRAIHYPPTSLTPTPSGSLRAGAHSDYGTLTILRTESVAGLEIQAADGSWQAVDHDPHSLVVNLGDSIAQWTNDLWPSTVHRVALTESTARQSFAFFHMANWDATIECLPTCRVDGEQPRHDPVQAGPWLMKKFRSTVER